MSQKVIQLSKSITLSYPGTHKMNFMGQKNRIMSGPKGGLITAVDVGSTKVACFIAQTRGKGQLAVSYTHLTLPTILLV